jgi:hypothetical protein
MSGGGADFTELTELANGLMKSTDRLMVGARRVTVKAGKDGALEAQSLIKAQITGVYLPHYAASITSETITADGSHVVVEFGADSSKPQGGMSPGVEFGSANTGPRAHHMPAADKVAPPWEDALSAEQVKALT